MKGPFFLPQKEAIAPDVVTFIVSGETQVMTSIHGDHPRKVELAWLGAGEVFGLIELVSARCNVM